MAKTIKEERLKWVLPVVRKEMKLVNVARVCPHGRRSLERWVAAYKAGGEEALEPKSTEPKRYRNETKIRLKELVVEIRKKTKKCALKIHWQLEKKGVKLHERTIGKILKKEGLVRKYRVRKITYKYIRAKRKPGELLEMDVKYVPGTVANKEYFQYTAIDTASRWRHLEVFPPPDQRAENRQSFDLHECVYRHEQAERSPGEDAPPARRVLRAKQHRSLPHRPRQTCPERHRRA